MILSALMGREFGRTCEMAEYVCVDQLEVRETLRIICHVTTGTRNRGKMLTLVDAMG